MTKDEADRRDAQALATKLGWKITKKAMEECQIEQKIKALQDELKAAVKAKTEETIEQASEEVIFVKGKIVSKRAIDTAFAHIDRFTRLYITSNWHQVPDLSIYDLIDSPPT